MKEINSYPLALSSWGQEEIDAIHAVIKKDQYSMSHYVAEFEKDFAKKFGSRFAVMVNSGSSANLLAIDALRYKKQNPLQAGDEIIVPSVSWSTTYYPIYQCGMKLVFVDIDVNTLNLDVTQLENALSEKTKAIFVPNILGNPADLVFLQEFCKKYNLYLIEDNCESMGAKINNKFAGTFGICGTFSTFFSHHISTMEGGVIVTDDEEIYHILLCIRSHGWTRHLPKENQLCKKNESDFYESFRFILPGYNFRPVEMSGAIGIEQLKKLDQFIDARRLNAEYFNQLFAEDNRFILQKENDYSSWFGFSFILNKNANCSRDEIIKKLKAANIDVRPIVSGNFLQNEVLNYLNYRIVGNHQAAQQVHNYGFFLGNHHVDMRAHLDYCKAKLST